MIWDDFIGEPSSSSRSNNSNRSKNKGKHHLLTDEEYVVYNYVDDDNVPLEFFTETSGKPASTDSSDIDLVNDNYSTRSSDDLYSTSKEDNETDNDVNFYSNIIGNSGSSSNSNNTNTNATNNNNNNENNHHDNDLTEDELLAIRLQFEEQEEFNNRMANINQYELTNDLFDVDDLQINAIYSAFNDLSSNIFMNPEGYVMDLRNYMDDDELDDSYEGLLRLEERIGNVKHNLDNNLINKNKLIKYNKNNKEIKETKCSICLLDYENNDELRKLVCSHFFHKKCIDNWFNSSTTCPICRKDVKEKLKKK